MSGFMAWMAAQERDPAGNAQDDSQLREAPKEKFSTEDSRGGATPSLDLNELTAHNFLARDLPAHDLPKGEVAKLDGAQRRVAKQTRVSEKPSPSERNSYWDRDPDLWMYRKKTAALLRRYMRWSLEAGRLPSLLGRELFRAKITAYTATTFEDRVIFLRDMERCLERLASFDREIIARVVLQEHEHPQAARLLHCTRRTIERRLPEVLDELSEAFLKARLLTPLPEVKEEGL